MFNEIYNLMKDDYPNETITDFYKLILDFKDEIVNNHEASRANAVIDEVCKFLQSNKTQVK